MRWVVLDRPHFGGTTEFIRRLRRACEHVGVEILSTSFEEECGEKFEVSFASTAGHRPIRAEPSPQGRLTALVSLLRELGADGLIINVFSNVEYMNMVRYLAPEFGRVMVIHTNSIACYKAAAALCPFVDRIVVPSQRLKRDLEKRGLRNEVMTLVPHAVDNEFFDVPPVRPDKEGLTLAYIGRLSDGDKGIFELPRILARVRSKPLQLQIVGSGPDEDALRERLRGCDVEVEWLGRVASELLPGVLAEVDIVIVPSRFEGFCYVAAEAMAAGRVVFASRIRGVTDQLITDGENGVLFEIGDASSAAQRIEELAGDRRRLTLLGDRARSTAMRLCSMAAFGEAYKEVMHAAMARHPGERLVLPIEQWQIPREMRPGLRKYVPEPVKVYLRRWRERLAR